MKAFSHDVTGSILVSQNNEMAAMMVFQTNPVRVELSSYVTLSFVPKRSFAERMPNFDAFL